MNKIFGNKICQLFQTARKWIFGGHCIGVSSFFISDKYMYIYHIMTVNMGKYLFIDMWCMGRFMFRLIMNTDTASYNATSHAFTGIIMCFKVKYFVFWVHVSLSSPVI